MQTLNQRDLGDPQTNRGQPGPVQFTQAKPVVTATSTTQAKPLGSPKNARPPLAGLRSTKEDNNPAYTGQQQRLGAPAALGNQIENDQMRRYGLLGNDHAYDQPRQPLNSPPQEEDPLKKYEDFMNNLKQNLGQPTSLDVGNIPPNAGPRSHNTGFDIDQQRIEQLAAIKLNEMTGGAPKEYDYLDYQENERRLRELTSQNASLAKYRTMLGGTPNAVDSMP